MRSVLWRITNQCPLLSETNISGSIINHNVKLCKLITVFTVYLYMYLLHHYKTG